MSRWGIVCTAKAGAREVLNFCAHHLDAGASEIHLFLDDPDPEIEALLAGAPEIRVTQCDAAYWKMRRPREAHQRPKAHQSRQFANANWAYRHAQVDWIAHIDIDEFIHNAKALGKTLDALDEDTHTARLRPAEALAGSGQPKHFKTAAQDWRVRRSDTAAIWPDWAAHLNGGFLSHLAGKLFVRTGLPGIKIKIHVVFQDNEPIAAEAPLPGTWLLHFHAADWESWQARHAYRMAHGSYRPGLAPPLRKGLRLHDLMDSLAAEGALRPFFDEVCTASPGLLKRLEARGRLLSLDLDLDAARIRRFGPLPGENT